MRFFLWFTNQKGYKPKKKSTDTCLVALLGSWAIVLGQYAHGWKVVLDESQINEDRVHLLFSSIEADQEAVHGIADVGIVDRDQVHVVN